MKRYFEGAADRAEAKAKRLSGGALTDFAEVETKLWFYGQVLDQIKDMPRFSAIRLREKKNIVLKDKPEIECANCGWQGYSTELVRKTDDPSDRKFNLCPDCLSNDITDIDDDEDDEIERDEFD